jgi:hypothetical protein
MGKPKGDGSSIEPNFDFETGAEMKVSMVLTMIQTTVLLMGQGRKLKS